MGTAREFARVAVLVAAGVLLVRHWPVLVSLALAGMAFRGAATTNVAPRSPSSGTSNGIRTGHRTPVGAGAQL